MEPAEQAECAVDGQYGLDEAEQAGLAMDAAILGDQVVNGIAMDRSEDPIVDCGVAVVRLAELRADWGRRRRARLRRRSMVERTRSSRWSEGVVSEIVVAVTPVVALLVGYFVGRRTERHAWVWANSSRHERRRRAAAAPWN